MRHLNPPDGDYERDWYLYLRKSKGRAGIARQRREAQVVAKRINGRIIAEFEDEDRTAFINPNAETLKTRDDYVLMLEYLRRWNGPKPVGILAWHADRLHRDVVESKGFAQICGAGDHPVETARSGSYDLNTATGRKRFSQDALDAEFEVDRMSERWRSQKAEAAEEGRWLGGPEPFGWRAVRVEKDEPKQLILDPAEAEAIRWGMAEVLRQGTEASLGAIGREWSSLGLVPRSGNPDWDITAIKKILLRARNAGLMEHNKAIITTNLEDGGAAWDGIVSEEEWRAVKQILQDPSRRTSPGPTPRWLGSGQYLCGKALGDEICGSSMRVTSTTYKDGRRRAAYKCKQMRGGSGGHAYRDAEMLDAFVEAMVIERLARSDVRAKLLRIEPPDFSAQHASLKVQQSKLAEWKALAQDPDASWSPLLIADGERTARQEIERIKGEMAARTPSPIMSEVLLADDVADLWSLHQDDLVWRRAALRLFVTVTVLPVGRGKPKGWKPGGMYFDPDAVKFDWKDLGPLALSAE